MNETPGSFVVGSDHACDLQVDGPDVLARHAQLTLDPDGHVWLRALVPEAMIKLRRQQRNVKARTISLCVGDQVFLGQQPVSLEHLCAVFGARAVLRPLPMAADSTRPENFAQAGGLKRPTRNPDTGILEEQGN